MREAYQFRIYPNKNQEIKLNSTLSEWISYKDQANALPGNKTTFQNSFTYPLLRKKKRSNNRKAEHDTMTQEASKLQRVVHSYNSKD